MIIRWQHQTLSARTATIITAGAIVVWPTTFADVESRITHAVLEVAGTAEADARASHAVLEVAGTTAAQARVTQVILEVATRPPLYDCPVTSPGPTLCGDEHIVSWVELEQRKTDGTTVTTKYSDEKLNDLSSYYGGKAEARVTAWGEHVRQLSDVLGQWSGSSMTVRLAEIDRALRGRFADVEMRALTNATLTHRMIRDSEYVAKTAARTLFSGPVVAVRWARFISSRERRTSRTRWMLVRMAGTGIPCTESTCIVTLFRVDE